MLQNNFLLEDFLLGAEVLRHLLTLNDKMVEAYFSLTSFQCFSFLIQTKGVRVGAVEGKAHFVFNDINAYHPEQFWKSRMLCDSIPRKFNLPGCSVSFAK